MVRLMTLLLLISGVSFANTPLTIRGKFQSDRFEGSTITLYYCEDLNALSFPESRAQKFEVTVKKRSFEFRFRNTVPYAYIKFGYGRVEDMNASKGWALLSQNFYLIGADSTVSIVIADNGCQFSGEGAMIQCQYKMYEYASKQETGFLTENLSAVEIWRRQRQVFQSICAGQMKILDNYRGKIRPDYSSILELDFTYGWKLRGIRAMTNNFEVNNPGNISGKKEIIKEYVDSFLFAAVDTGDIHYKLASRAYTNFVYQKLLIDLGINIEMISPNLSPLLSQIIQRISESYTGALREKLLARCFVFDHERANDLADIDPVLDQMKIPEYKRIVQEVKDKRGSGVPAFNFSLKDSSNRLITQDMFKGKFVILDFWFTGCGGCANLKEKMVTVYDHFKSDTNVVFVSISIDKDPAIWKRFGIRSGKYTHPGTINLFTNGSGDQDPVVKHYNVSSYPTLILIDREGRIVSASPPLPTTPESCSKFISLVTAHL